MKTIPTSPDANFSQVTTLSGQDFILTFRWNDREAAWYLDIADQDEVPISVSRKLTVGFALLHRCVDPRRPVGIIMAVDTTGGDRDPGRNDLGSRVELIYIEPGDL